VLSATCGRGLGPGNALSRSQLFEVGWWLASSLDQYPDCNVGFSNFNNAIVTVWIPCLGPSHGCLQLHAQATTIVGHRTTEANVDEEIYLPDIGILVRTVETVLVHLNRGSVSFVVQPHSGEGTVALVLIATLRKCRQYA
jgi:hypothetical protein